MAEGTMIDMGDGFGGMSLLSGGAGFVGGLVLGSLWNGNGPLNVNNQLILKFAINLVRQTAHSFK